MPRRPRRRPLLVPALITTLGLTAGLTACAGQSAGQSTPPPATASTDAGAGHGAVAGAEEVAEPPLALVSVDTAGEVGLLDLLSGDATTLGSTATPTSLATDGRFAFVGTADGVEIVDSGRWSWNHGDHFHYYLAGPRLVGSVPGDGAATVTWGMLSTAGSTGIRFADSGEAVLLDNDALAGGEIVERFRVQTDAGPGVIAPLDDGALVSIGERLVFHDATGEPTDATVPCAAASGAVTTVVGLAVGCADGAVLATWEGDAPVFEQIASPTDTPVEQATSFDGRKGRPTVAGLTEGGALWLLDTRERAWQVVSSPAPLVRAVAVDDADGHVVALDADGRVRVFAAGTSPDTGAELAVTEPLVGSVTDAVSLTVDGQRAYLNDPAAGVVLELDYADGARIARTLHTPTVPRFFAEVGR